MGILTGDNPISLKYPHADSNYFIWELMMLVSDKSQDTDWPIRVALNVMINLKWDEVMTRIGMICKQSDYLINPKEDKVICRNSVNV